MRRLFAIFALAIALLGPGMLGVAAQEATPEAGDSLLAGLGYPDLVVSTDGTDFDLPEEIEAGRYRVVLENSGDLSADLEFFQLPEGTTVDDYQAAFESASEDFAVPDWFFETVFNGGPVTAPGATGEVVLDLTPGEWVVNLYAYDDTEEGPGGDFANLPKTIMVTGEMPALDEPAGAITIDMVEMDFILPESISAGPQIWGLVNAGEQPHHMILAQVPDGTTEEQVLELVNAMFGPPAASPVAGATPVETALSFEDVTDVFESLVLSSDRVNWVEVDLAPGTYVAICFLPDEETGIPHIALGMLDVFMVE
ncbi:MAG: hypothetical protein M3464_01710 [Chloroflexota bacterium]|nr:hypothetical protein [Chloroflexota bacterium]